MADDRWVKATYPNLWELQKQPNSKIKEISPTERISKYPLAIRWDDSCLQTLRGDATEEKNERPILWQHSGDESVRSLDCHLRRVSGLPTWHGDSYKFQEV